MIIKKAPAVCAGAFGYALSIALARWGAGLASRLRSEFIILWAIQHHILYRIPVLSLLEIARGKVAVSGIPSAIDGVATAGISSKLISPSRLGEGPDVIHEIVVAGAVD